MRKPSANAAAGLVLVVVAVAVLLWQRPWAGDAPAADVVPVPDGARVVLADLDARRPLNGPRGDSAA